MARTEHRNVRPMVINQHNAAVHIGTLGTALQRGESSVAGTKKESPKGLSLKWRLPTLPQRSAVPSAMLSFCPCLSLLPSPLSAPQLSALSPARRRRAHRRPPRASDALREGYGVTHSWDIKDMVSLSFSSDHWAHEVIVELVASWEV